MKVILLCVALAATLSAHCEVRQVLEPLKPGEILARGWLKGQLELSLSGMGGHLGEIEPDQMDKPYVTRNFNPANGARGLVGWCAEMGGEYALGTAMLAYTLGDDALVAKAAGRIRAAMSLQEPDGYLGAYRPGDNRQEDFNAWGSHIFYNAMLLEYYRTGDTAILDAVHRGLLWFVKNWSGEKKTDYAGPTIIEPASVVYRLTGDKRLLDFCVEYAAWLDKPGRKNGATFTRFPLHRHAYHVAAIAARLKLPVALALAADRRDLLDAAVKMLSDHRDGLGWQATYSPCADGEWTAAPSCVGETEYCDHIYNIELFQWMALLTGETGYADAIERLVFNAAQGARGKDERTIGYMTSPNQWYATLASSRWGPEPFYGVYAPNVNAACCPANSIRLYPLYVMRAVLREGRDLRVMNYGPYVVRTAVDGADVSVESETDYPFDGRITLRVRADGWRGALRLRRPAWAESVEMTRNGKTYAVRDEGGVLTVEGPWRKGSETVTVNFGWKPVVRAVRDRDFDKEPLKTVEWGALVFAQPVEEAWTPVSRPKIGWGEDEAPPQPKEWPWFDVTCRNEPVPYALPQGLRAADIQVVRGKTGALPWQKPSVKLLVPMVRASAAYPPESRDGVHTPKPSQSVVAPDRGAEPERVELVPFGATCLRTTCFPTAETNVCRYSERVRSLSQLRGVMLPERDCTEDDFRTLREWGATLARYQMPRDWNKKNGNADIAEYGRYVDGRLDHLERVLGWARKYGIRIVIDLHAAPGSRIDGDELRMCHESDYADAFIETWRRIARRFRGRNEVYGYDLVNEPCQNQPSPPGLGFWELQERAARAIRTIDPHTPIIVESNQYASPWDYIERKPMDVDNVIYEAHMYSPNAYTHQGVFRPNTKPLSYPGEPGKLDRAHILFVLSQLRAFQLRYGAKVLIGEFSAIAWAKGAECYLSDCISVFNSYGWDWCYHAFREWEGWSVEHEGPDAERLAPSADNPRKRVLLKAFRP